VPSTAAAASLCLQFQALIASFGLGSEPRLLVVCKGLSAISDLTIANRAHLFYFIYGICRLPHVSLAICE